ncbi:uncharacterized protein LOC122278618 [Carya illinoinensis]|uniref:uncharacterized protein LOC122278618 n=1 Tax=Carya illinoinensis TaxID=32201 RepID=UPI001C718180|nr:uncharacterized protein LOC122278618 [Carya illinoinensis]
MEEELNTLWEGFTLTEQEAESVKVKNEALQSLVNKGKRCLIMKINADRVVNREAFRATMSKVWHPEGWIQFKDEGENKVVVEFQFEQDKVKVLHGRPWTFDRSLVCMQEIDGLVPLKDLTFTRETFWVQAHDMPMACMTKEVGAELFSGMERVHKVETDAGGCGWGCILRAKVEVDITKPLIRGKFLLANGVRRWIPFKAPSTRAFGAEAKRYGGVVQGNNGSSGTRAKMEPKVADQNPENSEQKVGKPNMDGVSENQRKEGPQDNPKPDLVMEEEKQNTSFSSLLIPNTEPVPKQNVRSPKKESLSWPEIKQVKILAASRQQASWKRRARGKSAASDSLTSPEAPTSGSTKRKVEPGTLSLLGHVSKQAKLNVPTKGMQPECKVVAARQHHQPQ